MSRHENMEENYEFLKFCKTLTPGTTETEEFLKNLTSCLPLLEDVLAEASSTENTIDTSHQPASLHTMTTSGSSFPQTPSTPPLLKPALLKRSLEDLQHEAAALSSCYLLQQSLQPRKTPGEKYIDVQTGPRHGEGQSRSSTSCSCGPVQNLGTWLCEVCGVVNN